MARRKEFLKKCLPVLAVLLVSMVIGITGATIVHNMTLTNPIKTPPVEGSILEETGNTKETWFKNDGESPVFLRIAYSESWETGSGDGLRTLPWEAVKKDGTKVRVAIPNWVNIDDWVDGGDGWLYYKKILEPGDQTRRIVQGVKVIATTEFADLVDGEAYMTGSYQLHFTMEIVQASDDWKVNKDAVGKLFGTDKEGVTLDNATQILTWPVSSEWNPNSDQS